jgi:hypothetical protein
VTPATAAVAEHDEGVCDGDVVLLPDNGVELGVEAVVGRWGGGRGITDGRRRSGRRGTDGG